MKKSQFTAGNYYHLSTIASMFNKNRSISSGAIFLSTLKPFNV